MAHFLAVDVTESRRTANGSAFLGGCLRQSSALGTKDGIVWLVSDIAQSNFALAPRAFGDEIIN
jgi:hypothetical protein